MAVKKNPRAVAQAEFLLELTGRRSDLAWRQQRLAQAQECVDIAMAAFSAADAALLSGPQSKDLIAARKQAKRAADDALYQLGWKQKRVEETELSLGKLIAWGIKQGFSTEPVAAPKPESKKPAPTAPKPKRAPKRVERRVDQRESDGDGFNTPFANLAVAIGTFDTLVAEAK